VTGATGFIGTQLCRKLVAAGAQVSGLSRNEVELPRGATHHPCDAGSAEALQAVFRSVEPELVYHLASFVSGSREPDAVLPTLHGNLVSSVNVLMACVEAGGCPAVLAGSLEEPDHDEPVPASPYAAAKGASSSYARMFHALYELPVCVARIFMVYGPEQPRHQLVPHVILSLLRGEAPGLSSGKRPVDWIFIDDVVEGLLQMGLHTARGSGCAGHEVDLGSGELVSVRQVAEKIAARLDCGIAPDFGALPDRPRERVRRADARETERLLGWRAAVSLDEGIDHTIRWARDLLAGGAE
jgi:nucleoside-diphosphate-sugar epimerase